MPTEPNTVPDKLRYAVFAAMGAFLVSMFLDLASDVSANKWNDEGVDIVLGIGLIALIYGLIYRNLARRPKVARITALVLAIVLTLFVILMALALIGYMVAPDASTTLAISQLIYDIPLIAGATGCLFYTFARVRAPARSGATAAAFAPPPIPQPHFPPGPLPSGAMPQGVSTPRPTPPVFAINGAATHPQAAAPVQNQPAAPRSRVFISHSSKDQEAAETICTALENRGIECWFSSRDVDPGENFQQSIHRAIRAAKVMVLVFTKNANASPEINKEIALAGQYELVVIPVRVEDVVPNDALAYELATRQWIDLFRDWERALERLSTRIAAIAAIETKPISVPRPPEPMPPAPDQMPHAPGPEASKKEPPLH